MNSTDIIMIAHNQLELVQQGIKVLQIFGKDNYNKAKQKEDK